MLELDNCLIKVPTLYALDKAGKIRVYRIFVHDIPLTAKFTITSYAGLLGKSPAKTQYHVTKGKNIGRSNETTPQEQAMLEAMSSFKDKLNEGYKSLDDLVLRAISLGYDDFVNDHEDHTQEEKVKHLYKLLDIRYNTDTFWRKLPMLAEKWKSCKSKVKYPVIVQPKLNGVRCIASYDADLQKVILASRGGSTYTVPYIQLQLQGFFLLNQNLELDGELYCPGKPLQEIVGAARNTKIQPDWLEYHVYDCLINKPQQERLNDLRIFVQILRDQFNADKIFLVKSKAVNNEQEVMKAHNECVAEGYEGLITRDPKANYQVSFRDSCLLKVKEFLDEEFELVDCEIDPGKTIGESFVFILKNNKDEQLFKARPTGTVHQKEIWYSKRDWVGKKATVRFQERTQGGLPHQGHAVHKESLPLMEVIRNYEGD